jgi:hypothetical protein
MEALELVVLLVEAVVGQMLLATLLQALPQLIPEALEALELQIPSSELRTHGLAAVVAQVTPLETVEMVALEVEVAAVLAQLQLGLAGQVAQD